MDKEYDKNVENDIENNIDDILKRLKDKYENEDSSSNDAEIFGDEKTENISPEEINERLNKKFMKNGAKPSQAQKSEYAIDESLMSEFIEESENVEAALEEDLQQEESKVLKEVSLEAEVVEIEKSNGEELLCQVINGEESIEEESEEENTVPEIVEIVIPIIDGVSEDGQNTQELDGDTDDYADDGDTEDFFGEEGSENAFVCFADDEVNDEDIFLDDEEDEEVFVEDEYENEVELTKKDAEQFSDEEENVKETAENEDDDLPWYSDNEFSLNQAPVDVEKTEQVESPAIILPLDEQEVAIDDDALDEFERAIDEELEAQDESLITEEEIAAVQEDGSSPYENDEEILGEVDKAKETDLDIEDRTSGEEPLPQNPEEEKAAYSLFGDKKQETPKKAENEEDAISFYKTIIAERTKRELQYGYPITEPSNLSDIYEGDFKESDVEPVDKAFDEVSVDSIVLDSKDEEAFIKSETNEDAADSDYYDSAEQVDAEYTDTQKNEGDFHPLIEFEEDTDDEGEIGEKELSKIVKILKQICMFALPIAIFWLEILPILGIVPDGFLDYESFRAAYVLIDAQLLIFMAALNYEKLLDGVKKIISPASNFYSVLSVTVIATLLGSILSCFCVTDDVPRLYNFISALYLLMSYLLEYFERKRRKEGTEILEKSGDVFTLRRSQGKNSAAEKMYVGGVDPDKSIFEITEIATDSFYPAFSREKVEKNRNFSNGIIIEAVTPAIIFGIIMAVFAIVFERGLYTAFSTFSFAVVAISPVAAIVAYYLPLLISHKRLSERGCVIAGYESAAELSSSDVLIFNDTHLFKSCDAREAGIKLFCDERKTRELFVSLACAYAKIGGPMQNTFSSVLGKEPHKVSMIRITRNGFEAVVDNKNNLIVGSAEYLGRYGIYVDGTHDSKETGVIYAALNSELCAKISVFYRTQPLFEALLELLDEYGVRAAIETYDPMITGKYVARVRDAFLSPVSVVHKNINDYKAEDKVKGKSPLARFGAFATASRLKLIELLCFCKSLCRIRKINNVILIGSYTFSCLLCTLFVINGAIESANMLWVLVYQLTLMGIYAFGAIKLLPLSFDGMQEKRRREELRKQERENKKEI